MASFSSERPCQECAFSAASLRLSLGFDSNLYAPMATFHPSSRRVASPHRRRVVHEWREASLIIRNWTNARFTLYVIGKLKWREMPAKRWRLIANASKHCWSTVEPRRHWTTHVHHATMDDAQIQMFKSVALTRSKMSLDILKIKECLLPRVFFLAVQQAAESYSSSGLREAKISSTLLSHLLRLSLSLVRLKNI